MSDEKHETETGAEIIAEMRAKAKHFEECSSLMVSESALALFLYPLAYRLEAAWNREIGKAERMCLALQKIVSLTNSLDENCAVDPVEIRDIARDALSESSVG